MSGEHSPAESGEDAAGERTPGGRLRARLERHALAVVALATLVALVVMFYYPVATVFVEALFEEGRLTLEVFPELLGDSRYVGIIRFTAYQALLSTLLSVALGVPLAYLLARYEFPGRQTLRSLTILPFVLPGIMVGVGFRAAFAESGPLNQALGLVGLGPVELLFTLEGIVIAHAFYNAPLVARLLVAAWEGVDASAVETARSLGASRLRAFRDVVAPQLYPAVLTGAALTFVFSFGTFPIVQALGGTDVTTVEVQIFRLVERLDYRTAAALAIVELFITLGVLYAYLRYEAHQRGHTRGVRPLERHSLVPTSLSPRPVAVRLGLAAYLLVAVVLFVLPIASMIQASFTDPGGFTLENYRFLIERQADAAAFQIQPWPAVRNSLLFGAATLLVALPMGVTVAVYSTRAYAGRKLLDAAAMAPFAVSSIVVGIGLLRGPVFGVDIAGVHRRRGLPVRRPDGRPRTGAHRRDTRRIRACARSLPDPCAGRYRVADGLARTRRRGGVCLCHLRRRVLLDGGPGEWHRLVHDARGDRTVHRAAPRTRIRNGCRLARRHHRQFRSHRPTGR